MSATAIDTPVRPEPVEGPATTLTSLRRRARQKFEQLGFPTTRLEEWRSTNVAPISRTKFVAAPAVRGEDLSKKALARFIVPEARGSQLVFVNGHFASALSSTAALPTGVLTAGLDEALRVDPTCVQSYLGGLATIESDAFAALNTAELTQGAFVYVPGGMVLDEPIHLLHLTAPGSAPVVTHPRVVVVLQRGSRATVVESYAGLDDREYWTNAVTEIFLEDGSVLEHIKLQRESEAAFHLAQTFVHQARDAHFNSIFVSLGGRLVRNEVRTVLDAPGAGCSLDGLYLATGKQHVDNQTTIDHAKPHCTSQELYKGILGGKSGGVFNGKVIVRKDAQKTAARQTNRNLLLSETATINTKPQLEIHADDVRCTHGATIGQLNEDAVFYLRSRGVGLEEARSLLIYGFASEILERIRPAELRAEIEREVLEWFARNRGDAA